MHGQAPNDLGFEFKENARLGLKVELPRLNKSAQLLVQPDYDLSFGIRAAQLFNLFPPDVGCLPTLEGFKARLGSFMEQYPDTPPVPGYATVNDNSLLSWRRTHTMQPNSSKSI